jgi:hypothetical protein
MSYEEEDTRHMTIHEVHMTELRLNTESVCHMRRRIHVI